MVQNHKVLVVLGLVLEYIGEAVTPVRKQTIPGKVGADGNVSDIEEVSFGRNINISEAETESPFRKQTVMGQVGAYGDIHFSDVLQESFVRKQMSNASSIDNAAAEAEYSIRKHKTSGKVGTDGDMKESSFVRKQKHVFGNTDIADAETEGPVRKQTVMGQVGTYGDIRFSGVEQESFVRKLVNNANSKSRWAGRQSKNYRTQACYSWCTSPWHCSRRYDSSCGGCSVCQAPTPTPAPPMANFITGTGYDDTTCPTGFSLIMDVTTCQTAAQALSMHWIEVLHARNDHLRGCHDMDDDGSDPTGKPVYYNPGGTYNGWAYGKNNGVLYKQRPLCSALPIATPAPTPADCFENNVKFAGHDIGGMLTTSSAAQCQTECQADSQCSFFTWKPSVGRCNLKSADTGRTTASDRISGPRMCQAAPTPAPTTDPTPAPSATPNPPTSDSLIQMYPGDQVVRKSMPLSAFVLGHDATDGRTMQRAESLKRILGETFAGRVDESLLQSDPALAAMLSGHSIEVMLMDNGRYIVANGNGRISAMKLAFADHAAVKVDVDEVLATANHKQEYLTKTFKKRYGL